MSTLLLVISMIALAPFRPVSDDVDQKYLNQKVIVKSPIPFDVARNDGGKYSPDTSTGRRQSLGVAYMNHEATVIAIQRPGKMESRVNAMGETVSTYYVGPVEVVIKCEDGHLAIITIAASSIDEVVTLQSDAAAKSNQRAEIEKRLQSLIGQKVYAYADSIIYRMDGTLENMQSDAKYMRDRDIPYLEPMTIEAAKYAEHPLGTLHDGAVLKLITANGQEVLAYAMSARDAIGMSFLLKSIPSWFTLKEIQAIKKKFFFRGMTEDALSYSLGKPERENNYGRGGRQLVYLSGKLLIYLDAHNVIEDYQLLDVKE